jgi:exopolysaccharide biosynthesis operon protein EpsL
MAESRQLNPNLAHGGLREKLAFFKGEEAVGFFAAMTSAAFTEGTGPGNKLDMFHLCVVAPETDSHTRSRRQAKPAARRSVLGLLCGILAGSAVSPGSDADTTDAFQTQVSNTLAYDSNLFRLSDKVNPLSVSPSPQRWDLINLASVGFKSEIPISRQRLNLVGNLGYQSFLNHGYLDNLNGDAGLEWNWQVGNDWTGSLSYSYTRFMGGFTNTFFFGKDMISNNGAAFDANYWFNPSWRVAGKYLWLDSRHSAEQRQFLDLVANSGIVGIYYQSTEKKDSYLGLRYRYTNGLQPNIQMVFGSLIDSSYKENEIVLDGTWTLTGKSHLSGDVGWLQRKQVQGTESDFQGLTFHLKYRWSPSEITQLDLAAYRELRSFQDLTATYIVVDGVSIDPFWSMTRLISVQAKGAWEQWAYAGAPDALFGARERLDTVWYGQITAKYEILRNAQLSLSYQATRRTSNETIFEYMDHMILAGVNLQFN